MDSLIARRIQYLFETHGYTDTAFGTRYPPLFILALSSSESRSFTSAQACDFRGDPISECLTSVQIPYQPGPTLSQGARPLSANLFRYSESAAAHHWDRASYEHHLLSFKQTLENLLAPRSASHASLIYALEDFSPTSIEANGLNQLNRGDIQFLLGMIEFYRNLLPASSDQALQAQLRDQGFGPQLARFTPSVPVSLEPRTCSADSGLTLHEVEIEGISYRVPVYLSPAQEAHWDTIRFRLIQYFNQLKVFFNPTQLSFLLSPGGNTPDLTLIFDERRATNVDALNRCQTLPYARGEYLPVTNRLILTDFVESERGEYFHPIAFAQNFFHEFGHVVLFRFLGPEGRNVIEAWRGAIENRFLAQQPYSTATNLFPSLTGEGMYGNNLHHCFDTFHEWFADIFDEYLMARFSPPRSLSPHRQARKTVMDTLFDDDGFHPERLTLSLILSAYQRAGASEIDSALLLRFYPNQAQFDRLRSNWGFSTRLRLPPSSISRHR